MTFENIENVRDIDGIKMRSQFLELVFLSISKGVFNIFEVFNILEKLFSTLRLESPAMMCI